ncbi:MAG: hypothetical protein MJ087_05285 [Lachnospiraceae bacterium]|nr:hypothetical protein [Lachnospiraceae bacterium]
MRIGIEIAVSIILIAAGVSIVFSVYATAVTVGEAKQYHHRVVSLLENSNYAEENCRKFMKQAKEDQYRLDIKEMVKDGVAMEKTTLVYQISLPFLKESKEYKVVGYSVLRGGI